MNKINNKSKNIAFLLLTYGDHIKANEIKDIITRGNIYVHPKNPNEIKSYLKKYIIPDLIETEWGELSIVEAELLLLENSYKNINNEWFLLMSSTCYPLKKFIDLKMCLNKGNKSIFNLTEYFIVDNINFFKSSQFWVLSRSDVEIILKYKNKYLNIFKKINKKSIREHGAYDEIFFLTVLMNEYNLLFDYYDRISTYSKWINLTFNLHPFTINKITPVDKDIIQTNNSFFIRKISQNFKKEVYKLNKNLTIAYFDKKELNINDIKILNNLHNKYNNGSIDLIIFYSKYADDNKIIPDELLKISICYILIIHSIFMETFILFKIKNEKYLNQWSNIEIIKFI